jgi:hypothetical protein
VSVRTRLQRRAANSVIVEAVPFLKRVFGLPVVLLTVPVQHRGGVRKAGFFAEGFDDAVGVVGEVVGVNYGDADLAIVHWAFVFSCKSRPNESFRQEVVEDPAEFVVTCFVRHEVIESDDWSSGGIVQW